MPAQGTPRLPNLRIVAKAVVDAAAKAAFRGGAKIERRARQIVYEERYATGRLAQSIKTTLLPPDGNKIVVSVSPTEPYGPFVELDTRPHVAPFEPFLRWATVKGFRATGRSFRSGSKKQKELARRGWLAVKHRGTKGIHYLERAGRELEGAVEQEVRRAVQQAVRRFAR